MNILITGGRGQLGSDCEQVLKTSHEVTCIDIDELDITDSDSVNQVAGRIRPDTIINCAAFTQVDACETQTETAWRVNAAGPENLARWASAHGARLVHISTDYVFDGGKTPPETYLETDTPNPLSGYGKSKLAGEQAVAAATNDFIILRTAWLYGFHGHNFLKTILKKTLAEPERRLTIVDDQYGSPTWSFRLAQQIRHLLENNARGFYHASAEGYCTWFGLARYFLEKLDIPHQISPCTTDAYPLPATRPPCAILENRRLNDAHLNIMEPWQQDLDLYINRFGPALIEECRKTN
ncbi:MAG: dTDP-4-dehydrorhamnose reductase [Desulfobacteraceae bacterium]|nr:MAG: dTDP-4-dehydrorhamnose reductase [Desulfobacteraceae bacterium]